MQGNYTFITAVFSPQILSESLLENNYTISHKIDYSVEKTSIRESKMHQEIQYVSNVSQFPKKYYNVSSFEEEILVNVTFSRTH